mgnify:CR=1 FL=1
MESSIHNGLGKLPTTAVGNSGKDSKDLKKDHELIHTLMGNDVSLRKDFIVENAINVLNLDI